MGYVPGPYNPITDLYDVEAKDAHAWVQVWFPRYGWQSFDPTAVVPLANPSPGSTLLHDASGALRRLPWALVGLVVGATSTVLLIGAWRRRRPRMRAERAARTIEVAGRRAGRRRRPEETLAEGTRPALDDLAGDRSGTWQALAAVVEASACSGAVIRLPGTTGSSWPRCAPSEEDPRARVCRSAAGALRRGDIANASSRLAPASSRGR